jgi:hypothetical protein
LRPSRLTNQIVGYCLAAAADHTGVLLHTVCVMSNHWHAVVSDPEARLPEFLERAHRLIAKCQNAALGRWENLWSSEKTSVVYLASEQDVLDKMAYVIAYSEGFDQPFRTDPIARSEGSDQGRSEATRSGRVTEWFLGWVELRVVA